jgi:hypothetical protein
MKALLLLMFLSLTPPDCVVELARTQLGVREATGRNDGEQVEEYLRATELGPGYAWCAAFVTWVHQGCGADHPALGAWSPNWFTQRVIYHYGRLTYGQRGYERPQPGDVFGIYFPSKRRIAHVGIIEAWPRGGRFITIEGNTNSAGSREGDGVYRKRRVKRQIEKVARWKR